MSRARVIQLAVTIVSLGFLIFFLLRLDWASAGEAISESKPSWLAVAVALVLVNLSLKSVRFRLVNRVYGISLSFGVSARIQTAGIGLALITPGRVGEAVKVSLLADRGVPTATGFGVVIFERIFDVLLLGLLALTLPLTLPGSPIPPWIGAVILAVSAVTVALILRIRRVPAFVPERLRATIERGLPPPASRRLGVIAPLALWTIAVWATESLTQIAIFRSVGASVAFLPVVGVMAASTLAGVASFLPGGLGVLDASLVGLYQLVGVPAATTVAFAAGVRLVNTAFPVCLSIPLFLARPRGSLPPPP